MNNKPFQTNITIKKTKINTVNKTIPTNHKIDTKNLNLTPRFINTHSHNNKTFLHHPNITFKLTQNMTTIVTNNYKFNTIPTKPSIDPNVANNNILTNLNDTTFTNLKKYFNTINKQKPTINNMILINHNTIHTITIKPKKTTPTTRQLHMIQKHIEHTIKQKTYNFSTNLIYRPNHYNNTKKIIELTQSITTYNNLYTTHIHNKNKNLLNSIKKTLTIKHTTNVHTHISHHKTTKQPN